jgi:ABC-type enterochelin transport system permease subunit
LGTHPEWTNVMWFVGTLAVGMVTLELFLELLGLKNNPRETLAYLRYGVLLGLLFSMISTFHGRLLHGMLFLITVGVALAIAASGIVNRRFRRASKPS